MPSLQSSQSTAPQFSAPWHSCCASNFFPQITEYSRYGDSSSMASVDTVETKKLFVFNYDDIVYPREDYFQNTVRFYYPCINAPFVNPPYWNLKSKNGELRCYGAGQNTQSECVLYHHKLSWSHDIVTRFFFASQLYQLHVAVRSTVAPGRRLFRR